MVIVDGATSTLIIFLASRSRQALFAEPRPFSFSGFAEPVEIGFPDADGDGKIDVCFGAADGEVFFFLGNGHGSLSAPYVLFAGPGIEGVRVMDLDQDGLDEILVATSIPGLIVLSGNPDGAGTRRNP